MSSWIKSGQFRFVTNRPGKKYAFRRNNTGNSEYNLPNHVKTKREAVQWLSSRKNLRPSHFKPVRKPAVFLGQKIPFNGRPAFVARRTESPNAGIMPWYTQERKNFMKYLAKLPPRSYGPETPTTRRLRRAAYKSEGHKVSPSPVKTTFSCTNGKGLALLGKGRQGIVFKGNGFAVKVCPRDLAAAHRREKQPALAEYDIHKEVFKACPEGIVEPYDFQKCIDFINPSTMNMSNVQNSRKYDKSKQSIIFMEICEGSLDKWLEKGKKTDRSMHTVISSVLKNLETIYKKYPEFRHNDLWPANIMISKRGFLIGDFGWARLYKTGTNPAVNTANGTETAGKWGVGPRTDPRYDVHFFLNNIRDYVNKKGGMPATMKFLNQAIPTGYRGASDTHVNEWRLKYDDPCTGLPTLDELIKMDYITPVQRRRVPIRSANLVNAKKKLRPLRRRFPIQPINFKIAKNKLKPVRPRRVISPAQLRAGKARLKARTTKRVPPALLKNARFDKLVQQVWENDGAPVGVNAWNKARNKAIRLLEIRMNRGNSPFERMVSPRRRSPPKPVSPPKRVFKTVVSPRSGRVKMMAPSGRMVYVDLHIGLKELKNLAIQRGKSIKGLRSKADIARKIFS